MPEKHRPVSYQQTLGTKTEEIRRETSEQNQGELDKTGNNLHNSDANFPE